jgi:tripartite-type tricarboxylate transporter receptor subunit TctC
VCGSAALVTPHISGGTVRPVMQLGAKRLERFKDTQTAIDAGFEDFTAEAWWGVFAPKGTPADVIAKTEAAIRETLAEAEIAKRLTETQEMTLVLGGPAALDTFFKKEIVAWGKVVRENGIKAQ